MAVRRHVVVSSPTSLPIWLHIYIYSASGCAESPSAAIIESIQPPPLIRSISTAVTTDTTTNNPGLAAGRPAGGAPPCTAHREDNDNDAAPAPPDAADDEVICTWCSTQRALLHCAQHGGARLCLPCDVRAHAAAAPGHRRAPLCDACHDAPAAALCADHGASLCAPCARAAGCHADRHATRPARAFTGIPDAAELARILYCGDTNPPLPPAAAALPEPEPDTWVPDLINIELLLPNLPSTSSWRDGNVTTELLSGSLIQTGGNFEGQMATGSAAALLPTGDGDELFMQQDLPPNLDDAGLDNFIAQDSNLMNSFNLMGRREGSFEASSSLGSDHPLIASCSEPIFASTDAVLESMAGNNAAYHQFSSVSSNVAGSSSELLPQKNTFYASSTPTLPRDEFPSRHFGFEVKPPCPGPAVSSPTTGVYQDQEATLQVPEQASSQDIDARTKQQEKRQEAKQRYKDKKKNRRFGKQIMYVSRKVRADTRNRVKGRFAKASSGSGHGEDESAQCGDDDQPTNS
ncbi:unnamed protein product [Urochloa humidicola]